LKRQEKKGIIKKRGNPKETVSAGDSHQEKACLGTRSPPSPLKEAGVEEEKILKKEKTLDRGSGKKRKGFQEPLRLSL